MSQSTGKTEYAWGRSDGESPDDRAVERLRIALQKNHNVTSWQLRRTITRSREMYFASTEVESVRRGVRQGLRATIYIENGDSMGSTTIELQPGEDVVADEKIAEAAEVARESEFPSFPLPGSAELPKVETEDPAIANDPGGSLEYLRGELLDSIERERQLELASAEFFVRHAETYFENSEGLTADLTGTTTVGEIVVLGSGSGGTEAENQDLRYRRRVEDLDVTNWVSTLALHARDATRARPMGTWTGPVVLDVNSIQALLGPISFHTSAASAYQRQTTWEVGDNVAEGGCKGDGITIWSDATVPFGRSTSACDGDGVAAQKVAVVENGVFRRRWAELRYGHYMSLPVTGGFANMVVDPGTHSADELLRGGEVLEVSRFSWLNPSANTGDFSSEIRFGYLHSNGRKIPIKGGSVAGNVFSAIGDCHVSREQVFDGNGIVPVRLRLNGLSTMGA